MRLINTFTTPNNSTPVIAEVRKLHTPVLFLNRFFIALITAAVWLLPCSANTQTIADSRLPISLDADYSGYDGKAGVLTFRGLRLTQGSIGIEADEGTANKLDFADSTWQFSGNVILDIEGTHIECDSADLRFVEHELKLASISGKPAKFTLRRGGDSNVTEGQAGQLKYDFEKGLVEFTNQASITEAGNRISSNYLIYDIKKQLINAQATTDGDDKVKITFTPPETDGGDSPANPAEPPQETPTSPEDETVTKPQNTAVQSESKEQ